MSDPISETKACDLLARIFRSRGYRVTRNFTFREYGVEFHADGWDPQARVGFEFLTSEDDDHDDLTLAEYQTLMSAQLRGELALFIIDEVEPLSAAELFKAAEEFLDEVAAGRLAGRRPPARAAGRAAKRAAPRPAAKKTRAKAGGQKSGAKKKAAKKKAATKRTAGKAAAPRRKKPRRGRGPSGR
jgi:hypothetical protein